MGLPMGYREAFPPPRVAKPMMQRSDIKPLTLAVESKQYSEIDLVLSHEAMDDPNEMVLDYLSQAFSHQDEQRFYGIRIFRFLAPVR
jgi:hypothetical protein